MVISKSLIAVAVSVAIALTGCATTGVGQVNPNLRKDEPKFFSKSGGMSCLIGASIAGAACALIKDDHKLAACLAAAAGGCAVAMTANYMLDSTRAKYHNLEDQLDATKAQVQTSINSTQTLLTTSDETLKSDLAEIERLKSDYASGKVSKDALIKKTRDMDANIRYMKERLDADRETLQNYKDVAAALERGEGGAPARSATGYSKKSVELDAKIMEMEDKIAQLTGYIENYASSTAIVKEDVNKITSGNFT